ncbi:site-specific integrase [Psychrobacillus glaciei]|uniref:hypothetical protein n=1 Tax=Psychrobacillus glaciei TaxID=2283160 RepID=UPI001CEF8B5C|nr:hypothetical protein [Psychrobacillus glaciei]
MQWSHFDIDNKTITIESTRDIIGSRSPKTKSSYRTIFIDDLLVRKYIEIDRGDS